MDSYHDGSMIVVDTTVLADLLAGEEAMKTSAERLLFEDPDWIAVGLWRYELGSALSKYVRFRGQDPAQLKETYIGADEYLLETVDGIDSGEVWEVSMASGLTFYDAAHVWLAQSRGLKLRTRDTKILRSFPDVAKPMPLGD